MMNANPEPICPACGADNRCAMISDNADTPCWCMNAAVKLPVPAQGSACYCANCLRQLAAAENTDAQ